MEDNTPCLYPTLSKSLPPSCLPGAPLRLASHAPGLAQQSNTRLCSGSMEPWHLHGKPRYPNITALNSPEMQGRKAHMHTHFYYRAFGWGFELTLKCNVGL